MSTYDPAAVAHARTKTTEWFARAAELLEKVEETQFDRIMETAELCADAIAAGGLVHMFGTGHSRIALEEMFPRYGSYPGFHPMAELSMTFHTQVVGSNGQRQAMFIERVEGLGEVILSNYEFGSADLMMVFSSGGTTAVPIEVAMGAKSRGLTVVAVTSVDHSMASEATHPTGTRLLDHADIVIDVGTPIGDSMVEVGGPESRVGPGSTVANAAIVNSIKVATATLLHDRGALPPVISSSAVVGSETSKRLFDGAYGEYARRISRVLATGDDV